MSSRSLEDILSSVTHDLRQPLQAVLLYLDALDRRTEREDARGILNKARGAAEALADQINALSLHNRLSKTEVEAYRENTPISAIADLVLKHAPDGAIALTAFDPDLQIETDSALLPQILHALTANALAHGGGAANLHIEKDGACAVFSVRDQGPGIDPADRARVFEPFVKLERGGEGLGLGLSNAQKLAALLGAEITIEDAEAGALFKLRHPLASGR